MRNVKWLMAMVLAAGVAALAAGRAGAAPGGEATVEGARFNEQGELLLPDGYRRWVFIGAPLTPHALNGEAAGFPEFHNVYVQPAAYEHYLAHGAFPEGTVLVKELQLLQPRAFPDGSRVEASGRGYFPGTPNGLDVSVKDSRRFAATQGWGFFNFGHHAPPYAPVAKLASVEECAGCHSASAHQDMVFTGFYQQLQPNLQPEAPAARAAMRMR